VSVKKNFEEREEKLGAVAVAWRGGAVAIKAQKSYTYLVTGLMPETNWIGRKKKQHGEREKKRDIKR